MNIKKTFTIHPFGQGLFYSGNILAGEKEFNFVYDCGSNTQGKSITDEIDRQRDVILKKEVNGTLDLLIISHFDADHVNKIQYLLKTDIKVKKIIAPFLPFQQRIALLLYNILNNNNLDANYSSLVIDPIKELSNFLTYDGEIIFMKEDSKNKFLDNSDDNLSNEEDFVFTIDNTSAISDTDLLQLGKTLGEPSKVKTVLDTNKGRLSLKVNKIIEFMFYQKRVTFNERMFYDAVYDAFLNDFNLNSTSQINDIKKAIVSLKSSKKVRNYFNISILKLKMSTIFDAMNKTALVLYLHQVKQNSSDFTINKLIKNIASNFEKVEYYHGWMDIREIIMDASKNANIFGNTLLTSDTSLIDPNDVDEIKKRYATCWNELTFFQIPHHGSHRNSNSLLHNTLPIFCTYFINFGTKNQYKHPHARVITSLSKAGNISRYYAINEFNGLEYTITL